MKAVMECHFYELMNTEVCLQTIRSYRRGTGQILLHRPQRKSALPTP